MTNNDKTQQSLNQIINTNKDTYINKQYKGIKTIQDLEIALNKIKPKKFKNDTQKKKFNEMINAIKNLWLKQNPPEPSQPVTPPPPEKRAKISPIAPILNAFKRLFKQIIHYTEKAMNQIFRVMIKIDKFLDHLFTFMFKQLKYMCFLFLLLLVLVFFFSKDKYVHMLLAVYVFIYLILGFAIIGLIYAIVALGKWLKKFWIRLNQITKMKKIKAGVLFGLIFEIIATFFAIVGIIGLIIVVALGSDYIKEFGTYLYAKLAQHT